MLSRTSKALLVGAVAVASLSACERREAPMGSGVAKDGTEVVQRVRAGLKEATEVHLNYGDREVHFKRSGGVLSVTASVKGGVPDGIEEVVYADGKTWVRWASGFVPGLEEGGWTSITDAEVAFGEGSIAANPANLEKMMNEALTGEADVAWGVHQLGWILAKEEYKGWEEPLLRRASCADGVCAYFVGARSWKGGTEGKFQVFIDSENRVSALSLQDDDLRTYIARVSYEPVEVGVPKDVAKIDSKTLIDARDGVDGEKRTEAAAREFERYIRETVAFKVRNGVQATLRQPESMFDTILQHGVPAGINLFVEGRRGGRLPIYGAVQRTPGADSMAEVIRQYEVRYGLWSVCVEVPEMNDGGMTYGAPVKNGTACKFPEGAADQR